MTDDALSLFGNGANTDAPGCQKGSLWQWRKKKTMAILSAIVSLPAFGCREGEAFFDHVQSLDRLISEYQKACSQAVLEEVAAFTEKCNEVFGCTFSYSWIWKA